MQFEWDKEKAETNFSKHGVRFDEAKTVFDDLFSVELFDPDHSDAENPIAHYRRVESAEAAHCFVYRKGQYY